MKRANDLLSKSLQRLSSGKRIVSPADDAGGLAVGLKLQSSLKRAAASRMNTQNGVSFLQMQDSVMKVGGEIIDRMAELKSFFNDVSKNSSDRETYNHEFHELQTELNALRAQKFNGVSLFATVEPDNNPLKIITSDDGLGEHIELSRTGLFENLKSKFGADSVLNSGSHGEYRQLVGDFTKDGGLTDASPGSTSRAYSQGDVVFMSGGLAAKSGYFMALTDVQAGVKIEDTAAPTSQWIRLADSSGVGFAEAYPKASEFDPNSMKYNSNGDVVAYLKDDILKVPAHWSAPGSYLFLKANADVPRGMTLADIFTEDATGNPLYIGDDKYFNYVGKDSSNQNGTPSKPTTEYIRANINLSEPSFFTSNSAASLLSSIRSNAANGFTPQYVTDGTDIFTTAFDWDLKEFVSLSSFNFGDTVFNVSLAADGSAANQIFQMHSTVKGTWGAGNYAKGDYVQHDGIYFQVVNASGATQTDAPHNPLTTDGYALMHPIKAGDPVLGAKNQVVIANNNMRGAFDAGANYVANDIVYDGAAYQSINNAAATVLSNDWTATNHAKDVIVRHNGRYYKALNALTGANTKSPDNDTANWTSIGNTIASLTAGGVTGFAVANVLGETTTTPVQGTPGTYFTASPFQAYDSTNGTKHVGNPTFNSDHAGTGSNVGVIDVTSNYSNVSNSKYWSKTHFGALDGLTVNTSYQYGDNIHYQGKNYIYTSHLASDNFKYLEGADPGTGYTEFENLVKYGAVVELPMYVDTIGGGGGAGLPEGVYYRPNQSLNFVDRLSDSGTVRTNNVERRSEVYNPPGDEIFNTQDDQFYGGLNAGNDGIYGTMDDFYSTTVDPNIALNGGHVDADADNNKDLLDTANGLEDFSVADFVDYIQTLANVRAVNGGTQSRLGYANRILEENEINLGAATSRIMDADMAYESTKLASQNVLLQAGASMVTQANSLTSIVLSLLQ